MPETRLSPVEGQGDAIPGSGKLDAGHMWDRAEEAGTGAQVPSLLPRAVG